MMMSLQQAAWFSAAKKARPIRKVSPVCSVITDNRFLEFFIPLIFRAARLKVPPVFIFPKGKEGLGETSPNQHSGFVRNAVQGFRDFPNKRDIETQK